MTDQSQPSSYQRDLILILGLLTCLGPLNIDMYLPGFPNIARDFHTEEVSVQLSLSSALFGLALGQLFVGPLSDTHGRKTPLIVAMALFAFASFLCATSSSILIFIIARFFQGLTAAAGLVLSRAIVRDVFSGAQLAQFFSRLMIINAIAPMIAPMLGGAILQFPSATWRTIFWFLTGFGVIAVGLVWGRLTETLPLSKRLPNSTYATLETFYSLFTDREFIGQALTVGLIHGGSFAYVAGTPFVYQNIYGVSPQAFSILFGINGIALVIGSWIIGRSKTMPSTYSLLKKSVFAITMASVFIGLIAIFKGPLFLLVAGIFLYMTCIGMVLTSTFVIAIAKQGHRAGSASAILGSLNLIIGTIVSPLVGINKTSAVPMAAVLFTASFLGLISFLKLTSPPEESKT
ncbi:multidrug effflux MFS transporter [Swingsia samuiensis]|uniref:Bcr/CflA family efflux transporter n=1 Tax=Swingsia samuiensis TaxID=1293412 RepID=A0A4Y6ULV7_9PROT|nr:multidrug effflux MFS transporter [Swingsia samuiensis]QDH17770.1 Bcr/CflA family efflux MFS transporter [Swingsia samuiensis]